MTVATLVPATNWYRTRRHQAIDTQLRDAGDLVIGRRGHSICSTIGQPVEVFDQAAIHAYGDRYGWPICKRIVPELPECRRCAKAAAKLGGAR